MSKKNKILTNILNGKKVLEIGANQGDISLQILEMHPSLLVVNEIDDKFIKILRCRLGRFKNVKIFKFDLFKIKDYPNIKFDIIILKEIFNVFPKKDYQSIIKNSEMCLNKNGTICIIDYFPGAIVRQLILQTIIKPHRIISHFKRYNHNKKGNTLLNENDLLKFFPKNKYSINLYPRIDPLNKHHNFIHKIIELIIPMKYLAEIKKNK